MPCMTAPPSSGPQRTEKPVTLLKIAYGDSSLSLRSRKRLSGSVRARSSARR
jgi:hypothetical protein